MIINEETIKMAWQIVKPKIRSMEAIFIHEKVKEIKNYRELFLAIPDENFKKLDEIDLFEILFEAYSNLAFLPNNEVLQKFKTIGVNTRFLKWFVHLSDILSEFRKIERTPGIKIYTPIALGMIFTHLTYKIQYELCQWLGLVYIDNEYQERSIFYKQIANIYRQRRTILKRPKKFKQPADAKLYEMIDQYEKAFGGDVNCEQFLKDTTQGETSRNALKHLVQYGIFHTVSTRKYYIAIFDLLKLIVKDEYIMFSEEEFIKDMDMKDATYDYDQYRYRRVQQIIEKK